MSKKHQHSPLMFAYANDAAKTDKPWLLWEYSESGDNWWPLKTHPTWSNTVDYRHHPHHEWILRHLNGERLQYTHEKDKNVNDSDWFDVDSEHDWKALRYRAKVDKPEFILINGIHVPSPIKNEPRIGSFYWSVMNIGQNGDPNFFRWDGDCYDKLLLKFGVIHEFKESAETHLRALISFTDDNIIV